MKLKNPFRRPSKVGAFVVVALTILPAVGAYLHLGKFTTSLAIQVGVLALGWTALYANLLVLPAGQVEPGFHARVKIVLHLAGAMLPATAYSWFMYLGYSHSDGVSAGGTISKFGSAAKDWMLATSFVGSFLALSRSSHTGSSTQATLLKTNEIIERIDTIKATLQRGGDVLGHALEARHANSAEDVLDRLRKMLDDTLTWPGTGKRVDAASLWVRDDVSHQWRILAGVGLSAETQERLRQPILTAPAPTQGIVANLAVSNQRLFVCEQGVAEHSWYQSDPDAARSQVGLAAAMIIDKNGRKIGALCVTSTQPGTIPGEDQRDLRHTFDAALNVWAAAFTIYLERWMELVDEANRDTSHDTTDSA